MTLFSFSLILISLVTFVAGQLFLKRAMESTAATGLRNARVIFLLSCGIVSMTISFFLTLGLLQRFDLSYLYPFQSSSVILMAIGARLFLRETLSRRNLLAMGFIVAGIALVSSS